MEVNGMYVEPVRNTRSETTKSQAPSTGKVIRMVSKEGETESSVVKEVSGRTALDWINDVTMQQIKFQLKTSDSSIKEIADRFNFPNQSFFGKYVKKHLGVSPAKYRNQSVDED